MLFTILSLLLTLQFVEAHSSTEEIDCKAVELPCYRFDYSSHTNFMTSFQAHASHPRTKWPDELRRYEFESSKLLCTRETTFMDLEIMLAQNDKRLWSIGRCMTDRKMSRYKIFLIEQAFIRRHIQLAR